MSGSGFKIITIIYCFFFFNEITRASFLLAEGFANVLPHHAHASLTNRSLLPPVLHTELRNVQGEWPGAKKGGQT